MIEANWGELEELVARADADRYVAALFTSPARRRGLIALYAFNHEVARVREVAHEPMIGHIRLGWWREQIGAIYEKRAVTAPLSLALQETVQVFALPRELFDTQLDARGADFEEAPFADEAALEFYASATSASLMQLAARVCGADARADRAARPAALAYAYTGYLRSLAFDAALRHCRLPLTWLDEAKLRPDDVFAAKSAAAIVPVMQRLARVAAHHRSVARGQNFPTSAIAALAPAALVAPYLRRIAREDVFAKPIELAQAERVARIAFAVLTWRI